MKESYFNKVIHNPEIWLYLLLISLIVIGLIKG
jgi:hypothetical protein